VTSRYPRIDRSDGDFFPHEYVVRIKRGLHEHADTRVGQWTSERMQHTDEREIQHPSHSESSPWPFRASALQRFRTKNAHFIGRPGHTEEGRIRTGRYIGVGIQAGDP